MKISPVIIRRLFHCGLLVLSALLFVACSQSDRVRTDQLNEMSYLFHYRNLDSTSYYASQAIQLARDCGYDGGYAEGMNNKAFVSIALMKYDEAFRQLDSVVMSTDNQIELLVADIQCMRLCQRMSKNKDFYTYREKALQRIKRIEEEEHSLDEHQRQRLVYAWSELNIVTSTYYYYIGLEDPSIQAMENISPDGEIKSDTAQWLNYLYNVGAGGIITQGSQEEINQIEMDYLFQCYSVSVQYGYVFWMANSLQAISEHLQTPKYRDRLLEDNWSSFLILDVDNVADSLLAGNLAQRSLDLFSDYGDVYQTAGAYRTLAQCYWTENDYQSSLDCLNEALSNDSAIFQAPDLVASIREQLSVVYAALDDRTASDYNRTLYLEKQDQTRQDRYFESRAEQLRQSVSQLNMMIIAIIVLMVLGLLLLFFFSYWRKRDSQKDELSQLLMPLEEWKQENERYVAQLNDTYDETEEKKTVASLRLQKDKRLNLEQRAKISIVNSITPFIDRILHEIDRLRKHHEDDHIRNERYQYIAELSDRINEYNVMLTQWIQLRQGELSLHIESFPLQPLFDIVSHGKMGFLLKNITLDIRPTDLWVKADRTLTLFMINTIADNARKFTPAGGTVVIEATSAEKYTEIAISDNGVGMTPDQIEKAFSVEKKAVSDETLSQNTGVVTERSHGFGLVNCKGIIEKYKKMSSLFSVCDISVESKVGEGSRFTIRLPKGIARTIVTFVMCLSTSLLFPTVAFAQDQSESMLSKAAAFSDSTSVCNRRHSYQATLQYADSAIKYLNKNYRLHRPNGRDTMVSVSGKSVLLPEVNWYHDKLAMNYQVILNIRNESAVAALALHLWPTYRYNNKVYTQLFKEMSADNTLEDYCRVMQESQGNKTVAVIILIILCFLILLAYFLLYYRHHVYYRFCIEKVRDMNTILLSDKTDEQKLRQIERVAFGSDGKRNEKKAIDYDERLPVPLQSIVDQILHTLRNNMALNQDKKNKIDMAEDEVRRINFEDSRLHICNSVLDNCLSTLKHETMYYPSRIRMLVNDGDSTLEMVNETASYYKELYSILSVQAMRQVSSVEPDCRPIRIGDLNISLRDDTYKDVYVLGDAMMLDYLFELLRKQAGVRQLEVVVGEKYEGYVDLDIPLPQVKLTEEECLDLFNPRMDHLPYLLCRQIIRDTGEVSNSRGCGIIAEKASQGIRLLITLAKAKKR